MATQSPASRKARICCRRPLNYCFCMSRYLVGCIIALIVIAHVFLWRSGMPTGLKLTFTVLNAIGWTIVIAPVFLVDRWLDTIRSRNSDKSGDPGPGDPKPTDPVSLDIRSPR